MKCLNCGFESNESFCPMCGTKLPEAVNPTPNGDSVGVVSGPNGPTAYYVSNNPYQQSTSAPQQGMPTSPYQQPQQGMPTPPPYAQPPQGMPTPPQYTCCPPQPKKQSNTLYVVLSIIVCSVIVIGTVINVVSSIAFKNSIYDIFKDVHITYDDDIYYEDQYYDEDYATQEDSVKHPINEPSEFKYGKITLKDVKITKDKFEFDDSIRECAFTFEIENTTDKKIQFAVPTVQVCSNSGDYYEDCYEWLYDDYESSNSYYEFTIEAGETKTFVTYYKVPTDVDDFSILFDISDYDYTYDFICYFEASLSQPETTVATTEPTTTKPATTESN